MNEAPRCPRCTMRPCMEQVADSWGPEYTAQCGPCTVLECVLEIVQLKRCREAAIAHLFCGDVKGALSALTTQRDAPKVFDQMTYEGVGGPGENGW